MINNRTDALKTDANLLNRQYRCGHLTPLMAEIPSSRIHAHYSEWQVKRCHGDVSQCQIVNEHVGDAL